MQEILEKFINNSSLSDWCKFLSISASCAKNDEERIESYHTLSLLLFYLPFCDEDKSVLQAFTDNFKFHQSHEPSDEFLQAEALLIYSFLHCEDPEGRATDTLRSFLLTNYLEISMNPYTLGAVVSCFASKCSDSEELKVKIQKTSRPHTGAPGMIKFCEAYSPQNKTKVSVNIYQISDHICMQLIPVTYSLITYQFNFYRRDLDCLI